MFQSVNLQKSFAETREDLEENELLGPILGHVGDGNFHVLMPISQNDHESYLRKVEDFNERLVNRSLNVGGTCSGEHGVGLGKKTG